MATGRSRSGVSSWLRRGASPLVIWALSASIACSGAAHNSTAPIDATSTAEVLSSPARPDPASTFRAATPPTVETSGAGLACGVERWSVKTLSDADASRVDFTARLASVAGLRSLPKPRTLPNASRIAPTELTTFTVRADVSGYKLENDRDIHVVIATPGNATETMIVELVNVDCLGAVGSNQRDAMRSARDDFIAMCGVPTTRFVSCAVQVDVVGVGFFDFIHGQTGVAPNGIELHPVLGITLVGHLAGTPPIPTAAIGPIVGGLADCDSFTSAKVRDWCRTPAGNILNCSDFSTRTEVTRFTATVDIHDVNGLDGDHDGVSCESLRS